MTTKQFRFRIKNSITPIKRGKNGRFALKAQHTQEEEL